MREIKEEFVNRDWLKQHGFEELPHMTIMNSLILDLDRRRSLSIGCVAEGNECMFITETDPDNPKNTKDLICVHNYDYDGFLTKERLKQMYFGITGKELGPQNKELKQE